MPIDFTTMDGYQFEDYISDLFRKLGFYVETTSYSNDGGVDLIATFSQPIFSGKYIIQCKNWVVPVGQPEVRDLYGVVMDRRANKGILITTSDFTQQAYDFAEGKNIELINGTILKKVIDDMTENSEINQHKQNDLFRNERYTYYKEIIISEPNVASHYLQMINYLREYVKQQNPEVCTLELFEEIIRWTEQLITRCYKNPSKLSDKQTALMFEAEAYIHIGKLAEATEILLKCNSFKIRYGDDIFGTNKINGRICHVGCRNIIPWNLYAAYKYINYDKGCNLLASEIKNLENKKSYFGRLFVYPKGGISSSGNEKTQHIYISSFYEDEIREPTFFYTRFYQKTQDEYKKEIDYVLKLHGII